MDYKQEAIKINDELLTALDVQLILLRLIKDTCPPKAYPLVGDDLETQLKKIEDQISRVRARKQTLEKEE
jgi:hypothetical protein